MNNSKPLVHFRWIFYPFLAFLFGITVARKLFLGDIVTIVSVVLGFMALATALFLFGKYKSLIVIFIVFLLGCSAFFLSYTNFMGKDKPGENVIIGRVTEDLHTKWGYYHATLDDVYVNGEKDKNIEVSIDFAKNKELKVGDKIVFTTMLTKVKLFELGNFNFEYLRDNVRYLASTNLEEVEIVGSKSKFDENIRMKVKDMFYEHLSKDNADICFAVLFGDKSDMSHTLKDIYRDAGVIHILSVSGLHVGFLIALVYFFLKLCYVKKLYASLLTTVFLVFLNILCGFAPSVMRASIMALVLMFSGLSGRGYDGLNSLGIAGFIILFINPLYAFDLGFLMSFASVAFCFILYPILNRLIRKIIPNKIGSYIALSVSAQLGIFPLVAFTFQNFNFLSFFANLVLVPIFGFVYPILFIFTYLSLILPFLSGGIMIFEYIFTFFTQVATFISSTAWKFSLRPFNLLFSMIFYTIIFSLSRFVMTKRLVKFACVGAMSAMLIVSSLLSYLPFSKRASISSVSTYYTNNVILTSNSGQKILVSEKLLTYDFYQFEHRFGVGSIDYAILFDEPSKGWIKEYSYINVKNLVAINGESSEEVEKVEIGKTYKLGDFALEYIQLNRKTIIVEINFDDFKFCFASSDYMSYNSYEEFISDVKNIEKDYNFIDFAGVYFLREGDKYRRIDYRDGNFQYSLNQGKFVLRGLD